MKFNKKIPALLLAVVLLFLLLPATAFAAGHDLTVKRDGSPAVEGEDYEWDGDKLVIKADGLTVSGVTEKETVEVAEVVTELTIDGLSVDTVGDASAITFSGSAVLVLKGRNELAFSGDPSASFGIEFQQDGEITGDGDLDSGIIMANGLLTFSASGSITVFADSYAISGMGGLVFTDAVSNVLAYGMMGNLRGVVMWGNDHEMIVADGLTVLGSTDLNVPEDEFYTVASYENDPEKLHFAVMIGDETAQSIRITSEAIPVPPPSPAPTLPPVPEMSHDLAVRCGALEAEYWTDYEWDGDKLVIKADGLTVSGETGREWIEVSEDVRNLTLEGVYIGGRQEAAVDFRGDGTLILSGRCVLDSCGIWFEKGGEVTGSGDLEAECIVAYGGALTISASGSLLVRSDTLAMAGSDGIHFTSDVSKVLVCGSTVRGAVSWSLGEMTLAEDLTVWGSTAPMAAESEICEEATYRGSDHITVGGEPARSVLILRPQLLGAPVQMGSEPEPVMESEAPESTELAASQFSDPSVILAVVLAVAVVAVAAVLILRKKKIGASGSGEK